MLLRIFILMFVFTFSLECQESIFSENTVKGHFKKRTVYLHKYKTVKNDLLSKINKWQSIFDSNGFEVERNLCEDDKINFKISYNYDSAKKLIEIISTGSNGQDIMICKYDDNRNLVQMECCNEKNEYYGKSVIEYTSDNYGNKLRVAVEYNQSGERYSVSICKYNDKGDCIEANALCKNFDYQSNISSEGEGYSFYKYKYDKHGNKIEKVSYNSDMSMSMKSTYKYDKYGNVTEQIDYNNSNQPQIKYTYIYSKHN